MHNIKLKVVRLLFWHFVHCFNWHFCGTLMCCSRAVEKHWCSELVITIDFRVLSAHTHTSIYKVKYPHYRPTWPRGYQEVKASRFLDTQHVKVVFIFRGWVDPGHMDLSDASETFPVTRPGIDPGTFRQVA